MVADETGFFGDTTKNFQKMDRQIQDMILRAHPEQTPTRLGNLVALGICGTAVYRSYVRGDKPVPDKVMARMLRKRAYLANGGDPAKFRIKAEVTTNMPAQKPGVGGVGGVEPQAYEGGSNTGSMGRLQAAKLLFEAHKNQALSHFLFNDNDRDQEAVLLCRAILALYPEVKEG